MLSSFNRKSAGLLILLFIFLWSPFSEAEPWLANRFAQNCAGCHAPGRLNRKPAKRRCTLSCQGCHVNPNGGGLRNAYGQWNSRRWLRSFYSDLTWSKKSVKSFKHQKYAKKKLSKKKKKIYAKAGGPLAQFKGVVKNEKEYFESSHYVSAKNKVEELVRIPRGDPYRTTRKNYVQVSGDFRFFYIKQSEGASSDALEEGSFFPMVFDVGVQVRPIRKNLSFVYEGRAFNANSTDPASMDRLFAGQATTRSAYLMVDDLPYNTYVQYGIYRPMFGLFNPNHNAMIYGYNDLSQFVSTKNIGFGAAPNVPFGIVNLILPTQGASNASITSEEGFVLTGGLRFVKMGAHVVFSYWDTKNETQAVARRRLMYDINAGVSLADNRIILNGDIMKVEKENESRNSALILTVDSKFRFWREMYFQLGYATANSAVAVNSIGTYPSGIGPGSGDEFSYGLKSFLTSGLEAEVLYTNKTNSEDGFADQKEDTMQLQLHAYF